MTAAARSGWCAVLAKLIQPWDAGTATRSLIALLPSLADLPDEAFTPLSAQAVAERVKRLPALAPLRAAIEAAFAATKPTLAAAHAEQQLAGEAKHVDQRVAELPGHLRPFVRRWQAQATAGFCQCGKNGCNKTAAHQCGFINRYAPEAWRFIVDKLEGPERIRALLGDNAPGLPREGAEGPPPTAATIAALKADYGFRRSEVVAAPEAPRPSKPMPTEQLRAAYEHELQEARKAGNHRAAAAAATRLASLPQPPSREQIENGIAA